MEQIFMTSIRLNRNLNESSVFGVYVCVCVCVGPKRESAMRFKDELRKHTISLRRVAASVIRPRHNGKDLI